MMEYKEIDYLGTKIAVSKDGKVIWNGKERRITYNHDGYSVCSIKTNKGWRSVSVARLVALAYIPNPNNLPEVNHKDYNRKNANVNNLEWISRLDNVRYSKCHSPNYIGDKNPNYGNRKLSERYKADKDYALEKQSRKGLQNGRCRKIKMYNDSVLVSEFDYIGRCFEYLIQNGFTKAKPCSIRGMIDKSIRNGTKCFGFTFVKE